MTSQLITLSYIDGLWLRVAQPCISTRPKRYPARKRFQQNKHSLVRMGCSVVCLLLLSVFCFTFFLFFWHHTVSADSGHASANILQLLAIAYLFDTTGNPRRISDFCIVSKFSSRFGGVATGCMSCKQGGGFMEDLSGVHADVASHV